MNPTGTNDLVITIGGDLSGFEEALAQIPQLAQQAFGQVQAAIGNIDFSQISQGADTVATSLSALSDASTSADTDLSSISDAASSATDTTDGLSSSLEALAGSTADADAGAAQLQPDLESTGEAARDAEGGLAGMAEQLVALGEALAVTEGLKDFGEEALTAYGNIEQATISLTDLMGSADQANEAIENLESLATSDALSFPSLVSADQKMTALGFSATQTATILQDAANAAAATGNGFDQVSNALDRMALSGTAGARQLASLGISAETLGQIMGTTADGVTVAFKALDQSSRIQVLDQALQKFSGDAAAAAQSINGAWTNLGTQWDFVLEAMGAALAPVVAQIANLLSGTVLPAIKELVESFQTLPGPIQEAIVVIGLAVAAVAPLAAILGALGLGLTAAAAGFAAFGVTVTGAGIAGGLSAITTESIAVASGTATATTAVGVFGASLVILGGIIVAGAAGWALGTWAYNQIPGMKALGDATADLILAIPGVTAAINSLTGATAAQQALSAAATELNAKLEAQGIIIPQGTQSTEQWAAAMAAAAAALPSAIENLQKFNAQMAPISNAQATLASNLQTTEQTLQKVTTAFATGSASQGQYETALKAVDTAFTALNGDGLDIATTITSVEIAFQNAQRNAQTAAQSFTTVSGAYQAGAATLSQYTTALNAMNKAQMDANNGIESAGTAALLAANDYVTIAAKATNAATTVSALGQAAADGTVSWTQYDTALKQLVTDEENANNGFISTATSLAVVQEAFQNLGVAEANAQTNLETATAAFNSGSASLSQYTAALQAAYKAQMDLNNGVASFPLQMSMAENAWQNAAAAANNAAIKAQAYYAALEAGYPVLQQTITAVGDAGAAMEKAAGGVVTWQSALLSLQSSQEQVNLNLQNANTTLGQAQQMYANGSITIGVYNKALQAQQAALAAVQGAAKTATSSTQGLAAAQSGLSSSLSTVGGAANQAAAYWENLNGTMQAVQTTYQMVNGTLVVGTNNLTANADAAQQVVTTTQNLNGTMVTTSTNLTQLAGAANQAATSFQNLNGTLVVSSTNLQNVATSASSATAGIDSVGAAAGKATTAVQSLGQELDAAMGATPGNLNMSLSANQLYNEPTGIVSGIGDTGLIQDPTWLNTYGGPNATANDTAPGEDTPSIYDSTSAITAVTKGAQSATTAVAALATSASSAATATAALATTTESVTQAQSTLNTDYQSYIQTGQGLAQVLSDFQTLQEANNEAMGGTTTALNNLATGATDATTALSGSGGVSDSLNSVAQGATLVTQTFDGAAGAITGAIVPSLNALNDGFTPLTTSLEGLSSASINASNYVDTFYQAVNNATPPMIATATNLTQLSTSLNTLLPVIGQVTKALNQVNTVPTGMAANPGTITWDTGGFGNPDISSLLNGVPVAGMPQFGNPNANLSNYNLNPQWNQVAPTGGIGGGATGADALSYTSTVPQGSTLTLNISAGNVVGQGGMQQLTTLIGQQLVQMLAAKGIRLNRQ